MHGLHLSWPECPFLSTLSLRRATHERESQRQANPLFLSTLSLRRATVDTVKLASPVLFLSTLSLRRATAIDKWDKNGFCNFYPRSPCGERLGLSYFYIIKITISIHALLAESDNRYGRPIDVQLVFLSTLSLRRATPQNQHQRMQKDISIHALLAESDVKCR